MDVRHTAPYLDCHCGVYGSLSLNHLIDQYRFETMKIITVIAAEGETIIGSRGLRTQYARVVAYWSPFRKFRRAADAQFEGAQHFKSLEEMLSEYQLPRYLPDPENTPGGRHWA
jgi:hypothetical protein